MLLGRPQLRHRAPVREVVGQECGVVRCRRRAAARRGCRCNAPRAPSRRRQRRRGRSRRRRPVDPRARRPRREACRGCPGRSRPDRHSGLGDRRGAPSSAAASMPESSAITGFLSPRGRPGLGRPRSRRSVHRPRGHPDVVGQRQDLPPGEDLAHLVQLVRVPRREHQLGARGRAVHDPVACSCTARSSAIPASASPSSSSSEARESGICSAVACTSTRPPSPVMTTLASTSALESSE